MTSTSLLVFASASSSDVTGIELDDSEANRFTTDISSIKEEVLPDSLKMERNFFFIKDGGEPKSGPVSRVKPKKEHVRESILTPVWQTRCYKGIIQKDKTKNKTC